VPATFKGLDDWRNSIDDATKGKPWISEEEKKDLLDKIDETRDWLIEKVQGQSSKGLDEEPSFTISQVETKVKNVSKLYKKVTTKKQPK
jgi:hypothetical protein